MTSIAASPNLLAGAPEPVRFNSWKHHAGFLRQRIREYAAHGVDGLEELADKVTVIGHGKTGMDGSTLWLFVKELNAPWPLTEGRAKRSGPPIDALGHGPRRPAFTDRIRTFRNQNVFIPSMSDRLANSLFGAAIHGCGVDNIHTAVEELV